MCMFMQILDHFIQGTRTSWISVSWRHTETKSLWITRDNCTSLFRVLDGVKLEQANTFHSHQPHPEGVFGMKRRWTVIKRGVWVAEFGDRKWVWGGLSWEWSGLLVWLLWSKLWEVHMVLFRLILFPTLLFSPGTSQTKPGQPSKPAAAIHTSALPSAGEASNQ